MRDRLIQLRQQQGAAKGFQTFAVARVVGPDGRVKQATDGMHVKKNSDHAERDALGKIDVKALQPGDTVVLTTDQKPCSHCVDLIDGSKNRIGPASLRVVTWHKTRTEMVDGKPVVVALEETKTPWTKGQAGSLHPVENLDFQRIRLPVVQSAPEAETPPPVLQTPKNFRVGTPAGLRTVGATAMQFGGAFLGVLTAISNQRREQERLQQEFDDAYKTLDKQIAPYVENAAAQWPGKPLYVNVTFTTRFGTSWQGQETGLEARLVHVEIRSFAVSPIPQSAAFHPVGITTWAFATWHNYEVTLSSPILPGDQPE